MATPTIVETAVSVLATDRDELPIGDVPVCGVDSDPVDCMEAALFLAAALPACQYYL